MTPLLFIPRMLALVLVGILVSACGSRPAPPTFSASGYIADHGVMRLWRKDDNQQPLVLMSVYSPFQGIGTEVTLYEYFNGNLIQIKRSNADSSKESVLLRFDRQGEVVFMQRQLATRREKLSADEIARFQFEAKRLLELTAALRAGEVRLVQGSLENGRVTTCAGTVTKLNLEPFFADWIVKRVRQSTGKLGIAWLESPEGQQLLLVANEDFCRWEPQENTL